MINIVLLVLNFLNIGAWGLERIYSIVCTVLFLIAAALVIWFIIEYNTSRSTLIASAALITVQFFLYMWDVKILQGEASN